MSPTNRHKCKYFHSTVQRAKDRRQKFHFCRLPFDVRPRNVKLNLSIFVFPLRRPAVRSRYSFILKIPVRHSVHMSVLTLSS